MTLREGLEKLAKECDGGLVDGDNVAEAIRALLSTADSKRCTCPSYLGSSPDERCPKHGSIDPPADSEQREVWTKERHEADMQDLRDEVADLRRKLADTESSRDSWMHDFSVLATRMDKLVSLLAVAEKRVDRNITQIKERISRELCLWIGMGEIEDTTRDSRKYILEETDRLYSMIFEPEEHFPVDGPNANEANEILGKPGYYK